MSQHIDFKNSSRAGRFKKKLVSEDKLIQEAPELVVRLAPLLKMLEARAITESEFTALSIIACLSYRFPGDWLGAKSSLLPLQHRMPFPLEKIPWRLERNIQKRLEGMQTLGELLTSFAMKSTPLSVNRALLSWSTNHYPLILFFNIPTPAEVLAQQYQGRRCVSVMVKENQLKRYILGERDSLSFTMHDLIHADHFYKDNECFRGQVAFYGFLKHCLEAGHFQDHLSDKKFEHEFEYLIADMNAYPIHLMKCLKSALIHYHPQAEVFFQHWLEQLQLTSEEREAFQLLNKDHYQQQLMDGILLNYFSRFDLMASAMEDYQTLAYTRLSGEEVRTAKKVSV